MYKNGFFEDLEIDNEWVVWLVGSFVRWLVGWFPNAA